MKAIAVFCASSDGHDASIKYMAYQLGEVLAQQQIKLIYGGSKAGLMGAVADGAIKHGGEVIGVLPGFLGSKEIAHSKLTELIIVDTMHERKTIMSDLCEGVITLPGGFGTMEELFEMLTWAQLGLHKKPIGILNINGFYDPLLRMMDDMVVRGFLNPVNRNIVLSSNSIEELLKLMIDYEAPVVPKWLSRDDT